MNNYPKEVRKFIDLVLNRNKITADCGMVADKPTINGRIYPKEVLEEAVKKYNQSNDKLGQYGFSENSKIDLSKVTHETEEVRLEDDGSVVANIKLLNTPYGNMVYDMIKDDAAVVGPVFLGNIDDNFIVNNAEILSVDIVGKDD